MVDIAIIDQEVPPIEIARRQPELSRDSGHRVLTVHSDFRPRRGSPLDGAHGLLCSTVAAGDLVGLDPQARILFLGAADDDEDQADLLLWAAGLPAGGRMAFCPPPPAPADIFSCSVMREGLHPKLAEAYRQIALHGRRGLGALLCFSAGNHRERLPDDRPDLASPFLLRIGASTRDVDGCEKLAPYSARGPGLDLCAPSSPVLGDRTWRLFPYGPVIAGVPRHCGTFAFRTLAETSLLGVAAEGDRVLQVADASEFLPGSRAQVELGDEVILLTVFDTRPGRLFIRPCPVALPAGARIRSGTRRLAKVMAPRQGDELTLQLDRPLLLQSLPASVLLGGPDDEIGGYEEVEVIAASVKKARLAEASCRWRRHYSLALDETHWAPTGGTSTAAPFVAGVASLVLARRPDLRREDLTEILLRTCQPIAETSSCSGARRVDAPAALTAASAWSKG